MKVINFPSEPMPRAVNSQKAMSQLKNAVATSFCALSIYLSICTLTSCCGIDDPPCPVEGRWVKVCLDWSESLLDEYETSDASVWFFPESGEKPKVLYTNFTLDSIYLPRGWYRVLAFNGTAQSGSHPYLEFRGTDRYDTFEVYTKRISPQERFTSSVSGNEQASYSPDILSVARTSFYVFRNAETTVRLSPRPITGLLRVAVRIQDMQYAAEHSNALSISGMAESVFLATGRTGATTTTHYAALTHRVFDVENGVATADGTMQATLTTFGLPATAAKNILLLSFLLRNGSLYPVERNVTGKFTRQDGDTASGLPFELFLNVGFDGFPVVIPETPAGDAGLDVGVQDWGPTVDIIQKI